MTKEVFRLVYTRDTTIIIQELWGRTCTKVLSEQLGWNNPHKPVVVHYLHKGVIEIWENIAATEWLMAQIFEQNIKDPLFYNKFADKFEADLDDITASYFNLPYFKRAGGLEKFVRYTERMMLDFLIYYYSAINNATPALIKTRARNLRERETFFASSNRLIKDSLIHLYPHLSGYQNTVLQSEIGQLPEMDELKKRQRNFLVVDGQAYGAITLEDWGKKMSTITFLRDRIDGGLEVKGSVAYPGHISGRVFLLFRGEQVQSVPNGAIIVSPMTTPDFLPAMKKAVAFVTDEGGITCHAAIVAREMKKPCVIGTKNATKVFKDGDKVEVDAEKGIVRKLS